MNPAGPSFGLRSIALGLLLLQLGWVLVLPPFRGLDEWDHAFRASAVAHGQWVAEPSNATRGTGAVVLADPDIVDAARPECERLPYTGPEECVGSDAGDLVAVASGAGRYHPLFYGVVGLPVLVLDGVSALYAMRLVALLLCLAMMMAAFAALRRWAPPVVPLVVCCAVTPMVTYSTSFVAPNGLEIASGLGLCAALAGIAHDDRDPGARLYVVLAVVAGSCLLTLRSLGPLWGLLILAGALIAWPQLRGRLRTILSSRSGVGALAVLLIVAGTSLVWIQTQSALKVGTRDYEVSYDLATRVSRSAQEIPQWTFQLIGAFPYRDQPAHPLVYATFLLLLGVVFVAAFRTFRRAEAAAVIGMIVLGVLFAFVVTVATIEEFGVAWQGRYFLPYLWGVIVISAIALARAGRVTHRAIATAAPLAVVGHVAGTVAVLADEHRVSPLAGTTAWALEPPVLVLAALGCCGGILLLVPLITRTFRGES